MASMESDAHRPASAKSWRRLGSSAALVVGFGALLILMAVICIDSLRTFGEFEANNTRIQREILYRERTLEQVQAGLYESSSSMHDYLLLETDPRTRETIRNELLTIRGQMTAALRTCIQSLPAARQEPFQHLASQLEGYWSAMDPVLAARPQDGGELRNSALRAEVLAQHAKVLEITREVGAVNDADLKDAEQRIADIFVQFRHRLQMVATSAFGLGLLLTAATILYVARLEKSVAVKFQESLQAQRELKDLSRRLVDTEERERRAISRELHDEVGQSLSALLMDVQNLTELSGGTAPFQRGLRKIQALAENCVNEVRDMALLLRPSMLDDLGLVAALEWQAREVSKRTGMIVDTVEENVSDDLPEAHRTCVYRVVQEALNNCSKHAYAKKVRVAVSQAANHLVVDIEDDGKGFDSNRTRGMGLLGMSERVNQLGGTLHVESDPVRGTRLRVDLPLPAAPARSEKLKS